MALAVAPALVVPALSLPVHRLAFRTDGGWPASYAHLMSFNALTNLLLGATDARDLNDTLDSLLRGQILVEK